MIKKLEKTGYELARKYSFNQISFLFSQSSQAKQVLLKYYKKNELLNGHANQRATERYKNRFVKVNNVHDSFYSESNSNKALVSSLGIGTQSGQPNQQDDLKMTQVLLQALTNGINYIDTDINFRYGKSQKIINACLNYLTQQKDFSRQQFFISTKFGYIPTDIDSNLEAQKLIQILKNQRYIEDKNIVEQIYGWGEGFIDFCIEKSRLSLGVQTIDNVFLNNFSESQMSLIDENQFNNRLKVTFKKLEEVRKTNRIKTYGICSFVGFRSPPDEKGVHLNLQKVCNSVKEWVGSDNGLKYIMLPLNLGMPQALLKWQKYKNQQKEETLRIFEVAQRQGLKVILCSPLFQGRVVNLPFSSPKMNNLSINATKHLQFIRSINSNALISTVFGTNNLSHLRKNLQVSRVQKVSRQDWKTILPIPQ